MTTSDYILEYHKRGEKIEQLREENARLREVLGKMIKLASTGDWDGEDPLIEAEALVNVKEAAKEVLTFPTKTSNNSLTNCKNSHILYKS